MAVKFTHQTVSGQPDCGATLQQQTDAVAVNGGRATGAILWCQKCQRVVQSIEVYREVQA